MSQTLDIHAPLATLENGMLALAAFDRGDRTAARAAMRAAGLESNATTKEQCQQALGDCLAHYSTAQVSGALTSLLPNVPWVTDHAAGLTNEAAKTAVPLVLDTAQKIMVAKRDDGTYAIKPLSELGQDALDGAQRSLTALGSTIAGAAASVTSAVSGTGNNAEPSSPEALARNLGRYVAPLTRQRIANGPLTGQPLLRPSEASALTSLSARIYNNDEIDPLDPTGKNKGVMSSLGNFAGNSFHWIVDLINVICKCCTTDAKFSNFGDYMQEASNQRHYDRVDNILSKMPPRELGYRDAEKLDREQAALQRAAQNDPRSLDPKTQQLRAAYQADFATYANWRRTVLNQLAPTYVQLDAQNRQMHDASGQVVLNPNYGKVGFAALLNSESPAAPILASNTPETGSQISDAQKQRALQLAGEVPAGSVRGGDETRPGQNFTPGTSRNVAPAPPKTAAANLGY